MQLFLLHTLGIPSHWVARLHSALLPIQKLFIKTPILVLVELPLWYEILNSTKLPLYLLLLQCWLKSIEVASGSEMG